MSFPKETSRKLTVLTVDARLKLIEKHEAGWKIGKIAEVFRVPQSTVSTVVKNKEKWLEKKADLKLRRTRDVADSRLEKSMQIFVQQARDNNLPLSGALIREKARQFASQLGLSGFKGSSGWLSKFVKRHHLSFKKLCGESASVDTAMCEDFKTNELQELVRRYSPQDRYNADETASFFKCLPDKTYTLQGESGHGGKYSKQRITVLCAVNMDGSEKLPLLVIGKSKKPRCFKNVKSLPVLYESNSKAWMTSKIFEKWMLNLDRKFEKENRQVLMFVDNCSAHPKSLQQKLKCINLQFFPPNATSVLQPLDLGIIKNLKDYYRYALVKQRLEEMEQKKKFSEITVLDAINHLSRAWAVMVKPTTIENCFVKAGFDALVEDPEQARDRPTELNEIPTIPDTDMARLAEGVTFEAYCSVDDGLITNAIMTDSDILEFVGHPVSEDIEDHEDPIEENDQQAPEVNRSYVRSSLDAMNRVLADTDNVPAEIYAHFYAVEKHLQQYYD